MSYSISTSRHRAKWESINGPDSRVGVDRYFKDTSSEREAHVNNDQGHITITVDGGKTYELWWNDKD